MIVPFPALVTVPEEPIKYFDTPPCTVIGDPVVLGHKCYTASNGSKMMIRYGYVPVQMREGEKKIAPFFGSREIKLVPRENTNVLDVVVSEIEGVVFPVPDTIEEAIDRAEITAIVYEENRCSHSFDDDGGDQQL